MRTKWTLAVVSVLAFLVPISGFTLFIAPRHERLLSNKRNALHELSVRIEKGRAAERNLPQFREDYLRVQGLYDQARAVLPAYLAPDRLKPAHLDSLWHVNPLHSVEAEILLMQRRLKFELTRFQPTGLARCGAYDCLPVKVELRGGLGGVMELLQNLERNLPFRTLSQLVIETVGTDPNADHVSVSFVITLYAAEEEPSSFTSD